MKFYKNYMLLFRSLVLLILAFSSGFLAAQDARFTVVIDAGHGGHDAGAVGAIAKEKDINLAVSLQLGAMIDQKFKDNVNVVFTRKTDRYLTLQERADIVNNHHADLFICVHTNSSPGASAYGAESYTLGLAQTKSNLDVAMRENSVITLEDNYKTKYQGFDPKSNDSYIMFELMQDKYIDRSLNFAWSVQRQFKNYCNRLDRGVRQAGFWVLHRSACPSVLVEVGFISNPAEERYLNSEQGQREMAMGIFNAFVDYKRDHDKKSGRQITGVTKFDVNENPRKQTEDKNVQPTDAVVDLVAKSTVNEENVLSDKSPVSLPKSTPIPEAENRTNTFTDSKIPVYKVQFLASPKNLKNNASEFRGLAPVESFLENGVNKYTFGNETDYRKIEKVRKQILDKFPEAFIIAFVGNVKMTAKEALKLKANNSKVNK